MMKLTDVFLAQLDAEAPRTRRALEAVPERPDWKPHDRSMPLKRLAMLVATMPSWLARIIDRDELDLAGSNVDPNPQRTIAELVGLHEQAVAEARAALTKTTDELLMKPWRLKLSGQVVSEQPKHVVVRDTFTHLAHHRGQLTVYLRLNDAPVPAIYGPSADDARFL
jgi:uncharacterized damage-inducible protein DinB